MEARDQFRQILMAIEYLHNVVGVCHRDIKPNNIMVTEDGQIKIMDFNISKLNTNKGDFVMMTHTGTECFSAPEMFNQMQYNEKIDMWSAGCVLYYMLSGYYPFIHKK